MFNTKDFNTMVLLRYHGFRWDRVETDSRGTKRVFIQDSPQLQSALLEYDNGETTCNMQELFRVIDEIKEFVHR
jgi:hypothetical protein